MSRFPHTNAARGGRIPRGSSAVTDCGFSLGRDAGSYPLTGGEMPVQLPPC